MWGTLGVDNDTFRWIIGGLIGLISSVGGFWMSHLTGKVDALSADILDRSQRISVLEANVEGIGKRLDRIESKIDYLIQGSPKSRESR